jgi:MerR family transcriptional regulator, copper efflux regulator
VAPTTPYPQDADGLVTISHAAQRTDLTPKAIRLYERKGLLPPPRRSDAGYRLYSDDDIAVLAFIRRARTLNLHLTEIADILDLQRGGKRPCGHVLGILDTRIAEIDRTITDLTQLRQSLHTARRTAAAEHHQGEDAVICRLIEAGHVEDRL